MKTTIKKLAFASPALIIIVLIFSSFGPAKRNSIANGGGVADGIHFSFNAIEQKDGVTGHIQFGDDSYSVHCATWFGTDAILFTTDGYAFLVQDGGEPSTSDYISEPIITECSPFVSASDFQGRHTVRSGNIQVIE
ncbi:MAG TPA: hypothetical protein VJ765_13780 [Chitinophagaceae bacterium]|nr:hypothetical protein [Chitinophagaceae bacterium]